MPTRVLLEGPAIEPLLAQVRDEYGSRVRIISADKVRSGGIGGFFAKQHYELSVEVPDVPEDSHEDSHEDSEDMAQPSVAESGTNPLERLLEQAESRDRFSTDSAPAPGRPTTAGRAPAPGLGPRESRAAGMGDTGAAFAELMAGLDVAGHLGEATRPGHRVRQPADPVVRPFTPATATEPPINAGRPSLPAALPGHSGRAAPAPPPPSPPAAAPVSPPPAVAPVSPAFQEFAPRRAVPHSPAPAPIRPAEPSAAPPRAAFQTATPSPVRSAAEVYGLSEDDLIPVSPAAAAPPPAPAPTPVASSPPAPTPVASSPVAAAPVNPTPVSAAPAPAPPPVVAPPPAVSKPEPVRADDDLAPVQRNLMAVGMPEEMARQITGGDTYAGVLSVLAASPSAPGIPDGAGEILVVAGEVHSTVPLAKQLLEQVHVDHSHLLLAAPSTSGTGLHSSRLISSPGAAESRAEKLQTADHPWVVVIDAPVGGTDEFWVNEMCDALGATALWAVVDATRKTADTARHLRNLGEVEALVVHSVELTSDPASVLGLDVPIYSLDGKPATPHAWAAMLCARIAAEVMPAVASPRQAIRIGRR
ncbi:hypothetical protein [Actinoplanes regularis]|uniref:hypothetical protein n=1 Tax=Actinoplanes regularis TaxID=52697 RepID=UPI0024A5E6EB|nr:hypothetical protein [Actinoplanes regularis]GLW33947.1 hypothetical protein Areg01_68850 [Actinoplanes regularis]